LDSTTEGSKIEKSLGSLARGIELTLLIYLVLSGSAVVSLASVDAQQNSLFSVTIITSTGNPVRHEYSRQVVNDMVSPCYLESFDRARNTATLKKFRQFWNATGLESIGRFSVETYKVIWIDGKDAAITALRSGEVNALDNNYQLAEDVPTLRAMGFSIP
jgi:hypothetical protein